jgi:hypothetical protein
VHSNFVQDTCLCTDFSVYIYLYIHTYILTYDTYIDAYMHSNLYKTHASVLNFQNVSQCSDVAVRLKRAQEGLVNILKSQLCSNFVQGGC